jgi:cystathionine beta-lyase/cystathionine gamma-synthase
MWWWTIRLPRRICSALSIWAWIWWCIPVRNYLNGHGDAVCGFLCTTKAFVDECTVTGLKYMTGAVMSPFDAYLVERGLKTLDMRMERHCHNAMQIAEFLNSHDR